MKTSSLLIAAAVAAMGGSSAFADYVPVYGGPGYNAATGTGYQGPSPSWQNLIGSGGSVALTGDATGLTSMTKYAANTATGFVPIQFGPNGFVEYTLPAINGSSVPSAGVTGQTAGGLAVGYQTRTSYSSPALAYYQAIRWTTPSQPVVLGNGISGTYVGSNASGVNAAGTAVGTSDRFEQDSNSIFLTATYSRPVRWAAGTTTATPLDVTGSTSRTLLTNSGNAVGITNDGTTYGTVYTYQVLSPTLSGNFGLTAVKWNSNGTALTELAHAAAPANGTAEDYVSLVRPNGMLLGGTLVTVNGSSNRLPTRWASDGSVTVLDLPANAVLTSSFNRAFAMNETGTTVGVYATPSTGFDGLRPARWDATSSALTTLGMLGTPPATASAWAIGINNAGIAVGVQRVHTTDQDGIALMWGLDGVAIDLNTYIDPTSGWKLVEANQISDTGWVSGIGQYDPDGAGSLAAYYRPFLIQVPEPTLAILGLATLPLLRRKRA